MNTKKLKRSIINSIRHIPLILVLFMTATIAQSQDLTINSSKVASIDLETAEGLFMGKVEKAIVDDLRRVFIVDNGNKQVHYFGPDGKFIRSFGNEGRGPGEFMRAVGAALSHDGNTFYVLDSPNARTVAYDIQDGNKSETIPLNDAAPSLGNDLLDFNGQLILLGNYSIKDENLHVINQNGDLNNSFGNFIDFSKFRHNYNGKMQLSIVYASHHNNKLLVTLMAPNRVKVYDSNLNLTHEFEDELLPKPWESHMIMRPDRYQAKFYSFTVNSQILSDNHYLFQWIEIIDPDGPKSKMHLELRDLTNGDVLGRYDIPENKSILNFARIDDQSAYMLIRDNNSYEFEIHKLTFQE